MSHPALALVTSTEALLCHFERSESEAEKPLTVSAVFSVRSS